MGVLPLLARVYLCADLLLLNKCIKSSTCLCDWFVLPYRKFYHICNSGAVSIASIACSCTCSVRAFKNLLRS